MYLTLRSLKKLLFSHLIKKVPPPISPFPYYKHTFLSSLVNAPLDITVDLTNPEPIKTCVVKDIVLTEVVCEDIVEQKCFNVAELVDAVNVVDQVEIILGEPNCNAVTLT